MAYERQSGVLLVDDDPFARAIHADALKARGFAVFEVESGRDAVRALLAAEEPPALIMTDLVMPDMDGRTLLGLLRVANRAVGVPIMIVTGCAGHALERELENEGAQAVVDKSWGPATIAEIAEAVLVMSGRKAA